MGTRHFAVLESVSECAEEEATLLTHPRRTGLNKADRSWKRSRACCNFLCVSFSSVLLDPAFTKALVNCSIRFDQISGSVSPGLHMSSRKSYVQHQRSCWRCVLQPTRITSQTSPVAHDCIVPARIEDDSLDAHILSCSDSETANFHNNVSREPTSGLEDLY